MDPENQLLKEGKTQVERALQRSKSPFVGQAFIERLLSDPRTSPLMAQPDFMAMIRDLQSNPQNMMKYISDPRMQLVWSFWIGNRQDSSTQVMEVGLGLNFAAAADAAASGAASGATKDEEESEPKAKTCLCAMNLNLVQFEEVTKEKEPEPKPVVEEVVSEGDKEKKQAKEAALKEKEAGNAAYKKKSFEEAIKHYTKALELWDEDITFMTNRAGLNH